MTEKQCTDCGESKPVAAFNRRRASRDGLQPKCRTCQVRVLAELRATNPAYRRNNNLTDMARRAAMKRLVELHRAEYDEFYAAEKRKRGLS